MSTIERQVHSQPARSGSLRGYPVVPESGLLPVRGDQIGGDRYWARDFMEREWQQMWTRVWHVGGRLSEIPEPGDYVVHNLRYESVVIVRQADGGVRAFYNVCQHRGNRLVWAASGAVNDALTCAYHGWKWGLDGALLAVQDPDDFAAGDPCGQLQLSEVRCDTWGGFVWYNMDPAAGSLADFLYPVPQLMAGRGLEALTRVVWRTTKVRTNWKFSPDNFNESYHLPAVHPQLQEVVDEDYRNTVFEMYANGHNRMIEQGQPSLRARKPNDVEPGWQYQLEEWGLDPRDFAGRARAGRVALQQQKRSLGAARGYHYFDRLHDDELTDYFHHTLFPNVTLTGTPDGVHFFRTEPDAEDPEYCTFDYWYFVPPVEGRTEVPTIYGMRPCAEAEHEALVFGAAGSEHHLGDFVAQDLGVAEAQQQGFRSRGFRQAHLSGQESRVRRFHEVLNDYLEGRR